MRIYPTKEQEQQLLRTVGACRFIYNYYLTLQINAYLQTGNHIPYADLARDLTKLRNGDEMPWLKKIQAEPLQQSLRKLDVAYNNFFRRTSDIPRFKSKSRSKQSFSKHSRWSIQGKKLRIQTDLSIKFRGSLPPKEASVKTITITKTPTDKWYASINTLQTVEQPKSQTEAIGLDLGLRHIAITSKGEKFDNPYVAKKQAERMRQLQRSLSRTQLGSNRRDKARLKVARLHEKIANQRKDYLHKVSSAITSKNHALIAVEDLGVANMLKNHHLSRSISDVSWSELIRQIEYKQQWRGGKFIKIDRFFPSSKTCNNCHFISDNMPLNIRWWDCPSCGMSWDRDVNAAKNILKQAEVQLGGESTESRRKLRVAGSLNRGRVMHDAERAPMIIGAAINK